MLITAHYYIQCLICQFDKQVPWLFVGTYCIAIHTPITVQEMYAFCHEALADYVDSFLKLMPTSKNDLTLEFTSAF